MDKILKNNSKDGINHNVLLGTVCFILLFASVIIFLWNEGYLSSKAVLEIKPLNKFNETIRVLSDFDYKPYSFKDENGFKSGRSVEIISEIANRIQVNLDLEFTDWQHSLMEVNDGTADAVLTCESTSSVNKLYNLIPSLPTCKEQFTFYSKRRINTLTELYDKKIAIVVDGNAKDLIAETSLLPNCVEFRTTTEAIEATIRGYCDCLISRYSIMNEMLARNNITALKPVWHLGTSYVCICCKKDNQQLMDRINGAIRSMMQDGTIDYINNKWLGEDKSLFTKSLCIREALPYFLILLAIIIFFVMIKERKVSSEIIILKEAMNGLFFSSDAMIVVDLNDNSYINYTTQDSYDTYIINHMHSGSNFFEDTKKQVDMCVHPDDKENILSKLDEKLIKENAKNGSFSFNLEYRLNINKNWVWYRFKAHVKADPVRPLLTIAVDNINEAKNMSMVFDNIADMLVSIYIVDLPNNVFTVVKKSSITSSDAVKCSYTAAMSKFAVGMAQEYYGSFNKLTDPEYIAGLLKDCNKSEYIYRLADSENVTEHWRRLNISVLQRDDNNKAKLVLFCFMAVEKDYALKLEEDYKNKPV